MPSSSISPLAVKLLRLCLVVTLLLSGLTLVVPARAEWSSLTGVLPAYASIRNVSISPDSKYVIFTADIDQADQVELYSVPITGTHPTKLNPPLVDGGSVQLASISGDSNYVLYLADQEVNDRLELYSVPIQGGTVLRLNASLVEGGNVSYYLEDVVRSLVVYIADQDINGVYELYSVPITGGPKTKLNPAYAPPASVFGHLIDLVGGRVVFRAMAAAGSWGELYSVPVQGGEVVKLSPPVSSHVLEAEVNPAFGHVLFLAKEVGSTQWELFGNDTAGGNLQKRNYTLAPGENVISFRTSPTGGQVVYTVNSGTTMWNGNLWRASPFAGASQLLAEAGAADYGVAPYDFEFSSDGNRVVYSYQKDATSPFMLQSVWVSGGPLDRQELFSFETGHEPGSYLLSPDAQRVVWEDYNTTTEAIELYSSRIAGGEGVYLGRGLQPIISPDSQRVIYETDPTTGVTQTDLHSLQITGGDLRNLSRLPANSDASNAVLSPDGEWVVFTVELDGGAGYELRVSNGAEGQAGTPTPTEGTPNPTGTPSATPSVTPTPDPDADNFLYLNILHR